MVCHRSDVTKPRSQKRWSADVLYWRTWIFVRPTIRSYNLLATPAAAWCVPILNLLVATWSKQKLQLPSDKLGILDEFRRYKFLPVVADNPGQPFSGTVRLDDDVGDSSVEWENNPQIIQAEVLGITSHQELSWWDSRRQGRLRIFQIFVHCFTSEIILTIVFSQHTSLPWFS